MNEKFLDRLLTMAAKAGEISLEMIQNSAPTLKPDYSVLTKADMAVSQFIQESLADLLRTQEHALIDEEDSENRQFFDQKVLERTPYLWVVDPIDGTRSFSNHMPLFAVSIGLLKELKPWLGVVYFPSLRELFYCDGKDAYFVQEAFSKQEKRRRIIPIDQQISRQSVLFGHDGFFKEFDWDTAFCQIMLVASAAIDLCWPTIGRGAGCLLKSYVWDFVGSWPILRAAGLDLRSLSTGKVLDRLELDVFHGKGPQTWKLSEHYLLSSERNYLLIKQKMTKKAGGH